MPIRSKHRGAGAVQNWTETVKHSNIRRDTGLVDSPVLFASPPAAWAWYDASSAYTDSGKTTLCSNSGSDVCYVMEDKSGNSRDLIQATAGDRPYWYSGQQNGLPALRFDGGSDYLGLTSITLNQPFSIFVVWKQRTLDGNYIYGNTGEFAFSLTGGGGNLPRIDAGTALTGTPAIGTTDFNISLNVFNGGSSSVQIRDGTVSTGNAGSTNPTALLIAKVSTAFTNIDVSEIIVYDSALDSTTGIGFAALNYLIDKYDL